MPHKPPSGNFHRSSFTLIGDSSPVGALVERARRLDALDGRLRRHLPETLARECQLANVRNGRLIFLASNSTWATRLRLHQTVLLDEARAALGDTVQFFAVKVAALPPAPAPPAKRKPLSAAAAEHLRLAAKSSIDPELAALYLGLASLASNESP